MGRGSNKYKQPKPAGKAWHDDLLNKVIAVATIFGFGLTTGLFIKSNDHKIELMELKQQFHEQLNEQINKERDCKTEELEKKMGEILKVVNGTSEKK